MGAVTKSRTSFFLVTGFLVIFVSAIVLTIVVVANNNKDKKQQEQQQQLRGNNDEVTTTKPPIPENEALNDLYQPVSTISTYFLKQTMDLCVSSLLFFVLPHISQL